MRVFTFCGGSCGSLQAGQLAGLQGGEHPFPGAALCGGLLLGQFLGGLQLLDGLLACGLHLLREAETEPSVPRTDLASRCEAKMAKADEAKQVAVPGSAA